MNGHQTTDDAHSYFRYNDYFINNVLNNRANFIKLNMQILPRRSLRYYITAATRLYQTLKMMNIGKTVTTGLTIKKLKIEEEVGKFMAAKFLTQCLLVLRIKVG